MSQRQQQQQQQSPPSSADELLAMYLESEELYMAYMTSDSAATATARNSQTLPTLDPTDIDDNNSTNTISQSYELRTLGEHNLARASILPMFPPESLLSSTLSATAAAAATTTTVTNMETLHLLLANVWIEQLTEEQFARTRNGAYLSLFKLGVNAHIQENDTILSTCLHNSYMWHFHQNLYVNTIKRLAVNMPIIDFNLKRLQQCIDKVVAQRGCPQTMLSFKEMSVALEFYLQIDVDLFFLKTCSFNNVVPRYLLHRFHEGLFCGAEPEVRFVITPCNKRYCLCCHPTCPRRFTTNPEQEMAIRFSNPQIHRFVNGYEAILNCPATCETTNCIYTLTCPCNQFDFVGQTALSFAKILAYHREEGNRIIREFLIGEINTEHLTYGRKSIEKLTNDKSWLYQHSTRCSAAMQLFLDENSDYWCFVPIRLLASSLVNDPFRRSPFRRTSETETWSSVSEQPVWARDAEEVHFLMENVPKPPIGYTFSIQQRQQQAQFFKCAKDRIIPSDNPDLYNANIVAVLPGGSSELFRLLVESLFVTHAECKLNQIGNLVYEKSDPNIDLRNPWCANVSHRQ